MRTRVIGCVRACAMTLPLAGCMITSDGLEIPEPAINRMQVVFEWRGKDDVSGTMMARLADGRQFHGAYFQIKQELPIESLDSLWDGWAAVHRGWHRWNPQPASDFLKHYDGKVLANLGTSGDGHMRCRFLLVRPWAGMRGGGEGVCQLTDGMVINATFAAAPEKTGAASEPQFLASSG